MTQWLNSAGAAGVGNHLWQSTVFAAVAWVVTLVLRKNQARVRYAVWLAASVKFLVPFSLLIGLGGMLPRPRHAVVAMPVYSAVDEVGMPFSQTVPVAEPTHAAMRPRHEWGTHLPPLLAGLWVCGVGVVLVVWCVRWRQVARAMRRAARVESGREWELLRRLEEVMSGRNRIPPMRAIPFLLSPELMEPGMFGIVQPVLIWPERLSERLDDEHIEAILAHEMIHARRRDNLSAALHMFVEAAFWFHPMVWWMERRMVEERERACDEAVLAMGSRAGVYAESLLKACRFCVESPLTCVAGITGADLNRRVRSIMTLRLERLSVGRKIALAVLGFVAIAGPVGFGVMRMIPMYGQVLKPTAPLPSYEIVVIKPSKDPAQGASTDGEQTHYLMTAKMLVQFAYGIYSPPKVVDLNVVGGPDWINTDVFSIVGKMESTEFEAEQKLGRTQRHERRQLMEQSLLAYRFKLKMHVETRDEPVYALTVMKGLKLTPAKDATGSAHVNPNPGSMTPDELKRGLIVRAKGRGFEMTVKGMTLDTFADALMTQKETTGRQVVNQTGLTGAYDFTLVWGPDKTAASDSGDVEEPGLFTAIRQQLGLKLVAAKGPAEVVVIDHIEKPVFDSASSEASPVGQPSPLSKDISQATRILRVGFIKQERPSATTTLSAAGAGKPLAFDVVSIKPAKPGSSGQDSDFAHGRFVATNITLKNLMQYDTYGMPAARIVGWPKWVDSARFDIAARLDAASYERLKGLNGERAQAATQLLFEHFLADHFKLAVHTETQTQAVYALEVAKGGQKFHAAAQDGERDSTSSHNRKLVAKGITMQRLADTLSRIFGQQLGRVVIDKTGLDGMYDLTLDWAPVQDAAVASGAQTDLGAEIFTAVEEQLGLKLVSTKGPVGVLVIDHAEMPVVN